MSVQIRIMRYPVEVNKRVRVIPVEYAVVSGALVGAIAIDTVNSSPGVGLFTVNGVVVTETVTAPVAGFRVFVTVNSLDDDEWFVFQQQNPDAKQAIVVTFRDSGVAGPIGESIYIKVSDEPPVSVASDQQHLFSDDFGQALLYSDRWTRVRTVGGVAAAFGTPAQYGVNTSSLELWNRAGVAGDAIGTLQSEVAQGRPHLEFRDVLESARANDSGWRIGIMFYDITGRNSQGQIDLTRPNGGQAWFGINHSANTDTAAGITNEPATTIHMNAAGELDATPATPRWGTEVTAVLPAAGVTTVSHRYTIDFDGHQIIFMVDGTVMLTRDTDIPNPSAKLFCVVIQAFSQNVGPAADNRLFINRVDVQSSERLVITGATGGGAVVPLGDVRVWSNNKGVSVSAGITSTPIDADHEALDVRVVSGGTFTVDMGADPQSRPAPDTGAINNPLAASLKADPDNALRTRARVLTDEGYLNDDFDPGVAINLTGNSTFTAGSAAVVGVGTAYTTEVQIGDYVILTADYTSSTPLRWGQVVSVTDDTHLTLERAYAGAGGAAGPARVASWVIYQDGVHGGEANANSIESLTVNGNAAAFSILYRRLGAGLFKGSAPVRLSWYGNVSARRANQSAQVGFLGWGQTTGLPDAARQVCFYFDGTVNTVVTCRTQYVAAAASTWDESVTLPNAGITSAYHLYEILYYPDRAVFLIDGAQVASHQYHIPAEYTPLVAYMQIGNTGATAATNLNFDWSGCASLDDVRAEVLQPDAGKLHLSAHAAQMLSLPAPNPAAIAAVSAAPLSADPAGGLRVRGQLLTDEDSFADDFGAGAAAMVRALTGTCTFTAGSRAVTGAGTAFVTEVRVGDYVALNADGSAALTQVYAVNSATSLTLVGNYGGAGGTGASSIQNYFEQIVGAAGNGVAAGIMTLDVTAANGDDTLVMRAIGAGGRKPHLPVRVGFYSAIDQRRANQLGELGVYDPVSGQLARFLFDGIVNTVVKATAQSSATAGDLWDETVTLPNAGITSGYHWYEIIVYQDRVAFFIDRIQIALHPYHLPDPYQALWLYAELQNTGAAAGATILSTDWLGYNCFDDVRVEATQPDHAKLLASVVPGVMRTATETSVVAANLSTLILAANPARKMFSVYNDSDKICFLAYGGAASATSATQLQEDDYYEDVWPAWTGTVYAFGEAGVAGSWRIRELT